MLVVSMFIFCCDGTFATTGGQRHLQSKSQQQAKKIHQGAVQTVVAVRLHGAGIPQIPMGDDAAVGPNQGGVSRSEGGGQTQKARNHEGNWPEFPSKNTKGIGPDRTKQQWVSRKLGIDCFFFEKKIFDFIFLKFGCQ